MADVAKSAAPITTARRPVPATIAVVLKDKQVLLVRRANPPDAGDWGYCGYRGGKIDLGESMEETALRELYEETGVRAAAQSIFTAVDGLNRADDGRVMKWVLGQRDWKAACKRRANAPAIAGSVTLANPISSPPRPLRRTCHWLSAAMARSSERAA